jgi:uncharacterized membrane protein YedE/YeeE
MCVLGGAVVVSCISYQFVPGYSFFGEKVTLDYPLATKDTFNVPDGNIINIKLIGGACCFGLGWGIVGLCPGPALVLASAGVQAIVYVYCPAYLVGAFLANKFCCHC